MSLPLTIRQDAPAPQTFARRVALAVGGSLKALSIRTVQLNIGLRCNLACLHCHVESSPRRREQMTWETMRLAIDAARKVRAAGIDITGGEPELHPQFRRLIEAARRADLQTMVRTNLTVLLRPEIASLPAFLKKHRVRLVASLPGFERESVDAQRGPGVYDQAIKCIQSLNAIGYGIDPTLPLDIVHNPVGVDLPPSQPTLERLFKRELDTRFGIRFTHLFTVANSPVGRMLAELKSQGKEEEYRAKLSQRFNPLTVEGLMCRHQLHVGPDGTLYDCDYNCALGLRVTGDTPGNIRDFDPTTYLQRRIATDEHCLACTAGRGSSWGGAIV